MWKYGFFKKYKFELHLRITNATITSTKVYPLLEILSDFLVGDSHQVGTVISVESLMVFDFNDIVSGYDPGCFL